MAQCLSLEERETIALRLAQGWSRVRIARELGRHPATVCRELERNTFRRWGMEYRAAAAQTVAAQRRRRRRAARLAEGTSLRGLVVDRLMQRHSPAQVAGWLRREFPDRPELWVSHETIYQAIFLQGRGGLRRELAQQVVLRSGRRHRQSRTSRAGHVRSTRPWIDLHISQRPAEVADRAVPGHWEGDLVEGRKGTYIATLVERSTRYCLLVALPGGKVSEHVVAQLAAAMVGLPEHLRRTMAWDQGSEMAAHPKFTIATGAEVYFCDPRSPWQRGSNENTNGLLRQFFPKSVTDFRTVTQNQLDHVAALLNTRPRETLGFATPAETLAELLVAPTA